MTIPWEKILNVLGELYALSLISVGVLELSEFVRVVRLLINTFILTITTGNTMSFISLLNYVVNKYYLQFL